MISRTLSSSASSESPNRRVLLAGLLLLTVGLALVDRGFTAWRNDPSTLPPRNEALPSSASTSLEKLTPDREHPGRLWLMLSGGGLVLGSIVLFGRRPL